MTHDPRPGWNAWGLELARAVALRADCSRRQVGSVIMTPDHSIVATGYNGSPPGQRGCLSDGACPRAFTDAEPGSSYDTGPGSCIAIHAEQNAIARASWDEMKSATMYITDWPCDGCWRFIQTTPLFQIITPEGSRRNR